MKVVVQSRGPNVLPSVQWPQSGPAPISAFSFPLSAFRARPRERGVALVITLIMLSVITFMAIAFLVISRGERSSVTTATDQSIARLGADNALERAQIELLAPMMASGNPFSAGLLVSTNFINPLGFSPGLSNPTNVAWFDRRGVPLTSQDAILQNLTNLLINPRPPVFIVTNRANGGSDFRYYIDLNRNGVFEPTGWTALTNSAGLHIGGNELDYVQGDPQWIGGLEFPDRNHTADNRFLYRYAYMAVPISQALDINYIHNYSKALTPSLAAGVGDGFLRNQGAGTWEGNLGAFFVDLNTNIWATNSAPYNYLAGQTPAAYTLANRGIAFDDALSLLRYRYFGSLGTVSSIRSLFGNVGTRAFAANDIDGYSAGPPMVGTHWTPLPFVLTGNQAQRSWPGADNTNHFFTTQEFFDPTKVSQAFVNHLTLANSDTNNTYNRYTFYRLLSQLGTDSAAEPVGKVNLNYDNMVQPNVRGVVSATNFFAWRPIDFFTNVANKLLTNAGFNLSLTNLQVYPTNFYTPSVHRLLQLAANIYDASTNRAFVVGQTNGFPTVFRPIFRRYSAATNSVVVIAGYREVLDAEMADARLAPAMIDLSVPNPVVNANFPVYGSPFLPLPEKNEAMVAGVPLIVGAKKGFPNFNELSMETQVFVSRLLEFRRAPGDTKGPVVQTNQMYIVGISNLFGLEAWNSYLTAYPRDLQLITSVSMSSVITNELGFGLPIYSNRAIEAKSMDIQPGAWKGWTAPNNASYSMVLPFGTTNQFRFLTNSTYIPRAPWFIQQTHEFARSSGFYVPHWWLNLNTKLQFILVDKSVIPNRIIDYVNLNNWERTVDITTKLMEGSTASFTQTSYQNPANQWLTNRVGNSLSINAPTYGIMNQIQVGLNGAPDWSSYSQDPTSGLDQESAVDGFRYNLMQPPGSPIYPKDSSKVFYRSNVFYAPFSPYRPIYIHTTWQVNDPLVHYTVGDLVDSLTFDETNRVNFTPLGLNNIGQINKRYRPWGGNPNNADPLTDNQFAVKDPLIMRSDDWDFPTNKFPNVGWLGRVHRGTPWQTVFLKSTNFLQSVPGPNGPVQSLLSWAKWSGNPVLIANPALTNMVSVALVGTNVNTVLSDAIFTAPTNDWHILDLFSTAFNDNAGRGQLSVNQTNLAAWSAVLSGVNVMPNASTNLFIQPAGVYDPANPPPLVRIVNGINNARTNFPNHAFSRLGDVLSAPELTVASPYLLSTNRAQIINDAVMERIPQQVLGLLHGGEQPPRFVIYSYGQALKPAPKSLYLGAGPYFGLCTNYQITAEVVTRAVVRIDGAPNKPRTVIESFNVLPPD